jgi:hypothetical protein
MNSQAKAVPEVSNTCNLCKFYEALPPQKVTENYTGICRIHPPTANCSREASFPHVNGAIDWCGDFKKQ